MLRRVPLDEYMYIANVISNIITPVRVDPQRACARQRQLVQISHDFIIMLSRVHRPSTSNASSQHFDFRTSLTCAHVHRARILITSYAHIRACLMARASYIYYTVRRLFGGRQRSRSEWVAVHSSCTTALNRGLFREHLFCRRLK